MARKHVMLMINSIPYGFPAAYVESESYTLGSKVQHPTKEGFPPIITPITRTLDVSLELPIGEGTHLSRYYKVAREMIRATQFMFGQRDNVISDKAPSGKNEVILSTEKNSTQMLGEKIKIPFTNLEVPWAIQITCAYFGLSIQTACCILGSFDVSGSPNSSNMQVWKFSLTEYDLGQLRRNPKQPVQKAPQTNSPNGPR